LIGANHADPSDSHSKRHCVAAGLCIHRSRHIQRHGRRGCAGTVSALGLSGVVELITAALETLSAALIVLPETRIWGLALGAMVLIAAVSTVTWHREYEHFPPGVALAALTGIGDKHGDRSNIDAREHGADGL